MARQKFKRLSLNELRRERRYSAHSAQHAKTYENMRFESHPARLTNVDKG
jgi:hypothetical protein